MSKLISRWREKLANWLVEEQTKIDLKSSYDELPSDVKTEAYSLMYNTVSISELFKFLIKSYDKQILELAEFKFNPMTTPSQMNHFFLRKFTEMKSLKARKNILTHFLIKGKEYEKIIKIRNFQENLKKKREERDKV